MTNGRIGLYIASIHKPCIVGRVCYMIAQEASLASPDP